MEDHEKQDYKKAINEGYAIVKEPKIRNFKIFNFVCNGVEVFNMMKDFSYCDFVKEH